MSTTAQPVDGNRVVRDAIVMSGWTWEGFNVPERIAIALNQLGARVLYCQNPVSRFRGSVMPLREVRPGISVLAPRFLGHRLNRIPIGVDEWQAKVVVNQVLKAAANLKLRDPLLVYPHGDFFVLICEEFKRRGFFIIHCCFDYLEPGQDRHIELSDITLTVSRTVFHQLKAKYGEKIALMPQVRWLLNEASEEERADLIDEFCLIPHPRLGYFGQVSNRLNLKTVEKLLISHPAWHFVHFGEYKCLSLPNEHVIPWRKAGKLESVIANLDVGFMPYDCHSNKNFHCMPLKLFDYFLTGMPVVSTPIVNLWEYADTIYFGDDAEELAAAIQMALDEPPDSPRRSKRMEIGRQHSVEALADALAKILFPQNSVNKTHLHEEGTHYEPIGYSRG